VCGAADFKGWFKSGDGTRIRSADISDACSRYLLRAQAVEKTDTERVAGDLEAALPREYGLPWWMPHRQRPPFASSAVGRAVAAGGWWIKLGIVPGASRPGHPAQNGAPRADAPHAEAGLHSGQDWRAPAGAGPVS